MSKPSLLIACAPGSRAVANALGGLLSADASAVVWSTEDPDVIEPGAEPLLRVARSADYGAVILTSEGNKAGAGTHAGAPSVDLVFEAALLLGHFGEERTFILHDAGTRLPATLEGCGTLGFDGQVFAEDAVAGLAPVLGPIRDKLAPPTPHPETDFVDAFLTVVPEGFALNGTYSEIITANHDRIASAVAALEAEGRWDRIVALHRQLQRHYELSGRYRDGVTAGRSYVRALTELSRAREAAWARFRDVGYLLILAGEHSDGRKELIGALSADDGAEGKRALSPKEFRFHCHRTLGLSYARDPSSDGQRAMDCFGKAEQIVETLGDYPDKQRELKARLLLDRGEAHLREKRYDQARTAFQAGQEIFTQLEAGEHVAIAKLQIGETIVASGLMIREAQRPLGEALQAFLRLGWVEGRGRTLYALAQLHQRFAEVGTSSWQKRDMLRKAIFYATRSSVLFEKVQGGTWAGRAAELARQMQDELGE